MLQALNYNMNKLFYSIIANLCLSHFHENYFSNMFNLVCILNDYENNKYFVAKNVNNISNTTKKKKLKINSFILAMVIERIKGARVGGQPTI